MRSYDDALRALEIREELFLLIIVIYKDYGGPTIGTNDPL